MRGVYLHTGETIVLTHLSRLPEAADEVQYFVLGQRGWHPELPPGQTKLYRRRRFGMRVDRFHRLPPGMADLRPEMIAAARRRRRPASDRGLHFCIWHRVNDDIARPFKMIAVDLDIA